MPTGGAAAGLVATKIDPPQPRAGMLSRPRLITRLGDQPTGRLTVVAAPAGWGKTSLRADWAEADGRPTKFAWVSLDADDNDEGLFWAYVVEALRAVRPDIVSAPPDLSRLPGAVPIRQVVPALINDFRKAADQTVLVLDDYHHITTTAIHDAVAYLIDHLPVEIVPLDYIIVSTVAFAICILSTVLPSWLTAATMKPVDGLRYE